MLKALLDQKASPDTVTVREGYTPLHSAARANQVETAKILFRRSSDVDILSKASKTEDGKVVKGVTAIEVAFENGHESLGRRLQKMRDELMLNYEKSLLQEEEEKEKKEKAKRENKKAKEKEQRAKKKAAKKDREKEKELKKEEEAREVADKLAAREREKAEAKLKQSKEDKERKDRERKEKEKAKLQSEAAAADPVCRLDLDLDLDLKGFSDMKPLDKLISEVVAKGIHDALKLEAETLKLADGVAKGVVTDVLTQINEAQIEAASARWENLAQQTAERRAREQQQAREEQKEMEEEAWCQAQLLLGDEPLEKGLSRSPLQNRPDEQEKKTEKKKDGQKASPVVKGKASKSVEERENHITRVVDSISSSSDDEGAVVRKGMPRCRAGRVSTTERSMESQSSTEFLSEGDTMLADFKIQLVDIADIKEEDTTTVRVTSIKDNTLPQTNFVPPQPKLPNEKGTLPNTHEAVTPTKARLTAAETDRKETTLSDSDAVMDTQQLSTALNASVVRGDFLESARIKSLLEGLGSHEVRISGGKEGFFKMEVVEIAKPEPVKREVPAPSEVKPTSVKATKKKAKQVMTYDIAAPVTGGFVPPRPKGCLA